MPRSSPADPDGELRLERLAEAMLAHPHLPMAIADGRDVREHIADSISGLGCSELSAAGLIGDLGAGAGFPGLALAALLPDTRIELIEGSSRKSAVARELADAAGIANVVTVNRRSEEWASAEGRDRYDAVTARAVGSLAELCELASPLLREDGVLVAWKGRRVRDEEAVAAAGAEQTAIGASRVVPVVPFPGSNERHLYVYRKLGPTPAGLPRRPGRAHKRPLGSG